MFGITVDAVPPQVCGLTVTAGLAVFCRTVRVAAMSLASCGRADQSSATTPATCGAAIDVPERLPYEVSEVRVQERTLTPGAEISGFNWLGM